MRNTVSIQATFIRVCLHEVCYVVCAKKDYRAKFNLNCVVDVVCVCVCIWSVCENACQVNEKRVRKKIDGFFSLSGKMVRQMGTLGSRKRFVGKLNCCSRCAVCNVQAHGRQARCDVDSRLKWTYLFFFHFFCVLGLFRPGRKTNPLATNTSFLF